MLFCFNDTATTEIYTLSLHDALPILSIETRVEQQIARGMARGDFDELPGAGKPLPYRSPDESVYEWVIEKARRSEEHTSELQSRQYLVCCLLLEKKM